MAPTTHYQYLVIGGGSGGVASARRAAAHGAKTLVIEGKHFGGTCVNVGCVPKKVMWNAAHVATRLDHAKHYGFDVTYGPFDWKSFKGKRDAYVERLRGIYERNLENEKVDYVYGWATLVDKNTVKVKLNTGGEQLFTADHILLAAGGAPLIPITISGYEHGITSDGFFEVDTLPQSVGIVGAGYIGVEISGVLQAFGIQTHMFIRGDTVLRKFDAMIQSEITESLKHQGVNLLQRSNIEKMERTKDGRIAVYYTQDSDMRQIVVDHLIWAVGRYPLSHTLKLDHVGVELDKAGKIVVDGYQNTSVPSIYSVGDIAEEVELTPAAIAAGRKLSDRLFGGKTDAKLDYENIPSVVFSHPEAGSIGLTEIEARAKYDKVKVYASRFINMYFSPFPQEEKEFTHYKLVCEGDNEKVVGLHLVGDQSSEILQGFGVAIKMGATKADFDNCVAIHPTAAEELVTLK